MKASARSSYTERKLSSILAADLQATICMSRAREALPCHHMHQGGDAEAPGGEGASHGERMCPRYRGLDKQEGRTGYWGTSESR